MQAFPKRELLVAAVIVAVHIAGLYALAWTRLKPPAQPTVVPMAVQFLDEPMTANSPPTPPPVAITSLQIPQREAPQLVVELALQPTDHSIAVQVPMAEVPTRSADRNTPKLVTAVEYMQEPMPRYPPQSRRLREQGLVILRVLIDEAGKACSIDVETSSGHPRLDAAAREAIQRATFRPYLEDGAPRRALVLIPIEFSLSRSSA